MIKNYLITSFRNLWRVKFFSIINILGLAIGMAGCLLILQYVSFEFSYDKFHKNYKDIYRVQYNVYKKGECLFKCAAAVPAVGPAMKDNFPEVLEYARAFPVSGTISYKDKSFRESKMQIATPSFIQMLTFPLLIGDKEKALNEINTVVISEEIAKKYFGDEDPLGKTLTWNGEYNFTVTGILKNVPDNSHIKFGLLFSYMTLNEFSDQQSETAWGWYDFNTYIQLAPGTDPQVFQIKFQKWLENLKREEWESRNSKAEFILQPIADIHLYSDLLQESEPQENGDGDSVYLLLIIAFFILFIAWVNFINLSTSRSIDRAKEVGIRKVVGAGKEQLIYQFILESFLINIIAAFLAILLVALVIPHFNQLMNSQLSFGLLAGGNFWITLLLLFFLGAILSGVYPAFVMTSFKPVSVLKGKFSTNKKGTFLRKALVIFQFTASIFLITGTITVYNQLLFMKNQDLGIDLDQTIVIRTPGITDSLYAIKYNTFKNEVLNLSQVKSYSAATNVPGDEIFWANGIRKVEETKDQSKVIYMIGMDESYIPAFDLDIIAGRNFSKDFSADDSAVIINENAIAYLGFKDAEEAVNRKVRLSGKNRTIVGVINNYNQLSLKTATIPLIFLYQPVDNNRFLSVKINSRNPQESIQQLHNKWDDFFPGNPFDYFILDEFYNKQYRNDEITGNAAGIFAILAIIIASLGLFALASLNMLQKTREIGIRKVMGAKVSSISILLSKEYVKLILWSNIIAAPVSYFLLDKWLENFAYRIQIGWESFVLSAIIIAIIAFLAIGFKLIKTTRVNPVDTLKYE
nr:ABC transporter permease [Bacteroidota bacterium]